MHIASLFIELSDQRMLDVRQVIVANTNDPLDSFQKTRLGRSFKTEQ